MNELFNTKALSDLFSDIVYKTNFGVTFHFASKSFYRKFATHNDISCKLLCLWKMAPFIVLIKTIEQNSSNFVWNIVPLEISLNFVEKHRKVIKKYWSSFAFFFHIARFYVCVMINKLNFKSSVMCNVTHVWMVPTGLVLGEEWWEEFNT